VSLGTVTQSTTGIFLPDLIITLVVITIFAFYIFPNEH
jgi:hypothetical protein